MEVHEPREHRGEDKDDRAERASYVQLWTWSGKLGNKVFIVLNFFRIWLFLIAWIHSNYMLISERLLWARTSGWFYERSFEFGERSRQVSSKPDGTAALRRWMAQGKQTWHKKKSTNYTVFSQVELQLNQNNGRITIDGDMELFTTQGRKFSMIFFKYPVVLLI